MGRSPCCSKEGLNRGAWTALEDKILKDYIKVHGEGRWRDLPRKAGLKRCGKSCRLRWLNYLRPDIKRGNISHDEEELIIRLHKLLGNRWSLIAGRLPGRTDNEIKNYWNTILSKKVHDQQHCSASDLRNPNLPNCRPHQIPSMSSPTRPNFEPEAQVVRAKPVRCHNILTNTNHDHNSSQNQSLAKAPEQGLSDFPSPDDDNNNNTSNNNNNDLVRDVDMADLWLSDLLNSEFSGIFDFNYSDDNNNNNDDDKDNSNVLSPSSNGSMMFPEGNLDEHCLEPNVAAFQHGFTSFLELSSVNDWLAE